MSSTSDFKLLDIHSHILPNVDDGAQSIDQAIELLQMLKAQGVEKVIATPHFYPLKDNLQEYTEKVTQSYNKLLKATADLQLPKIYLGSELLYFNGISQISSLDCFCLNGSEYLLLELGEGSITSELFEDILNIYYKYGVKVIIAHIERYYKYTHYRRLIRFVMRKRIPVQINALSFESGVYFKVIKKLLKKKIPLIIASDAHSPHQRPPKFDKAIEKITAHFGSSEKMRIIKNSQLLCKKIIPEG